MSIQEEQLITADELKQEWTRLRKTKAKRDSPQYEALMRRVLERDDLLFQRYAKPYLTSDYGRWIAISLDGAVKIGDRPGELGFAAREAWGEGNYTVRRLAEFTGVELR